MKETNLADYGQKSVMENQLHQRLRVHMDITSTTFRVCFCLGSMLDAAVGL